MLSPCTQAARHPNVANIVMHHALIKALEKHNLALQKKEKLLQQHMAGDVQSQQLPRLSYDQLVVSSCSIAPAVLQWEACSERYYGGAYKFCMDLVPVGLGCNKHSECRRNIPSNAAYSQQLTGAHFLLVLCMLAAVHGAVAC